MGCTSSAERGGSYLNNPYIQTSITNISDPISARTKATPHCAYSEITLIEAIFSHILAFTPLPSLVHPVASDLTTSTDTTTTTTSKQEKKRFSLLRHSHQPKSPPPPLTHTREKPKYTEAKYTQSTLQIPRPIADALYISISRLNNVAFAMGVTWELQFQPCKTEWEALWDELEAKLLELLEQQPRPRPLSQQPRGLGVTGVSSGDVMDEKALEGGREGEEGMRYGYTCMSRWVRFYRYVPGMGVEWLGKERALDLGREGGEVEACVREMAGLC